MRRNHRKLHRFTRAGGVAALLALMPLGMSGCNIVGPALVIIEGPPKTEALVTLDDQRPHVIFVDDLRSRMPKRSLRDEMAVSAEEAMLNEGVLSKQNLITARAMSRVAAEDSLSKPTSVAEMGKKVGAEVVIYVSMEQWTISRDGATVSPSVRARVKIIDAENGARIWPPGGPGYPLTYEPSNKQPLPPTDLAARTQVELSVARQFGLALAQMFYTYESRQSATK